MHDRSKLALAGASVATLLLVTDAAAPPVAEAQVVVRPGSGGGAPGSRVQIRPGGRRSLAQDPVPPVDGPGGRRPSVFRGPQGRPPVADISPENVASLEMLFDFPTTGGVSASPVVTDDFVYVASWDQKLHALDPMTGETKWVFDADFFLVGRPTLIEGGDLVIGDWLSNVYRLNASTGKLVWKVTVGDVAVDSIWSPLSVAAGRVFVGIASHTDVPCTKGRTVALDLATGAVLWERVNVPDRICDTDTAITCATDTDCAGGTCVEAIGAGVTAIPAPDATGEYVYVNTVGCYTFPSVGDSDAMMKLDAATGETIWLNRVDPPEQFGFCGDDPPMECSTDPMCGGDGGCEEKANYHDFGFLNGPLLVDVSTADGGTRMLVISGSKNGTLYAFDPDSGDIVWENVVVPKPVSPGFAGWGSFNGALGYDGRLVYAALHGPIPEPDPERRNLQAFDPRDGSTVWTAEFPRSWGHASATNGLVFAGNNSDTAFFAHDAATGERKASFPLPTTSVSQATVAGDRLYVGYGTTTAPGGMRAYKLP